MRDKAGQPPKYEAPEEMKAVVDAYFQYCDTTIITKQVVQGGDIIKVSMPTPYTMAGLALALNMSRETLNQYGKNEKFSDIIIHARRKIEQDNVTKGLTGIYDPKTNNLNLASNYGYSTKEKIEISDTTKDITPEMRREWNEFQEWKDRKKTKDIEL